MLLLFHPLILYDLFNEFGLLYLETNDSLKMLFMSSRNITQLSVFRRILKIAKVTISFVMSVHPPVCPNGTTLLPLDGFE